MKQMKFPWPRPRRLAYSSALALALIAGALAVVSAQGNRAAGLEPTVILVSFDGFRWDYPTKAPTPNLKRLMSMGVRAENLIPSFPSKTFPNHYSIVTGLYPGHHGILANNMWDPTLDRPFALSRRSGTLDPVWWGGEPLWVTLERVGILTAPFFWPGSESSIGGITPHYGLPYEQSLPGNDRVDRILGWLDLPAAERPRLLTLYFEDTDTQGHHFGPDSLQVQEAIRRDDQYLGRLLDGLEGRALLDRVNIVVVSDHGMAGTSRDRVVIVDDYIDAADAIISDISPLLGLFPAAGKADALFASLSSAHPRLKVYRRETTPERWHYRDSPRSPVILGVMDPGWQIMRRTSMEEVVAGRADFELGEHGYDPLDMSMRGIFVAAGPLFKRGAVVDPFENVSVYNLLAAAVGVPPAKNDGDPELEQRVFREALGTPNPKVQIAK